MNVSILCLTAHLAEATLPSNFCAYQLPLTIGSTRSVLSLGTGDILALARDRSAVVYLEDTDGNDVPDTTRDVVSGYNLNHGLTFTEEFLYASSASTVYRWPLKSDFTVSNPTPTVVVNGIPSTHHTTRTLIFDDLGLLYVSVGSGSNVDSDASRSRLLRYNVSDSSKFPMSFSSGEVFIDGLRNEVALAIDRHGVMWGAENGADSARRADLGGYITEDNPAEELNRFPEANKGLHYGYPYCWTEYSLPAPYGMGRGTVWAWESFMSSSTSPGIVVTDQDCRANYIPPEVAMQAHSAPLGMKFYHYKPPAELPSGCTGTFPASMDGYLFIAFHGSWNRVVPTGYKVVYVPMTADGDAAGEPVDLLAHAGSKAKWPSGFRPVDVSFDDCGRLLVSSDGSASEKIVRIEYGYRKPMPCTTNFLKCTSGAQCCSGKCGLFGRCSPGWLGGW